MEREVRLYGPLAKFVGQRKFLAEVANAAEAVRMLLVNFPGLSQHMADQHYKVIVDGLDAEVQEIHYPFSQTIKIVPVLGGAGGGAGKIIAGVALVAFAIATAGAGSGFLGLGAGLFGTSGTAAVGGIVGLGGAFGTAATGFVLGSAASSIIGAIGVGLIFGGVSQLLSPTPQIGQIGPASMNPGRGSTSTEGTELDPQESYSFSGIQNTSRQGTPCPVVYGETIVGSVVLSAGVDVDTI